MRDTAVVTGFRLAAALVVGLALATPLACGPRAAEPDVQPQPDVQPRIDAYCARHCAMDASCAQPPDGPLENCEQRCQENIPWREGDEACLDARWEYYECRATVTECEVWRVGYGVGDECDPAFETQLVACFSVSDGG